MPGVKEAARATLRYQPHPLASILHLLLLGVVFALFAGRKPGVFRSETILSLAPDFYSHVSNFSLSYLFYAGAGFMWLMMGVPMRRLVLAAAVLALANVVYELFIPVLNTRDPVDAVYGVVGTLLAFAWLCLVRRFALKKLPGAN